MALVAGVFAGGGLVYFVMRSATSGSGGEQMVLQRELAEAREALARIEARREAENKAAEISQRNRGEIESAKEQAINEIHAHLAELSTQIAGKILQREISAADQQTLVNESLAELTQSGV